MGSSRLPGKVLADVCGKPMLLWQVDRVRNSRLIDDVVVATTNNKIDDEIASLKFIKSEFNLPAIEFAKYLASCFTK